MPLQVWFGLIFFIFNSIANAQHVLPVYSDKWYTKAVYHYIDSCGKPYFTYHNLIDTSPSFFFTEQLAQKKRRDCTWSTTSQTIIDAMPDDFPGNKKDWRLISSSITPKELTSTCRDTNGATIETLSMNFYPKFHCPDGSRYGMYANKGGYSYGCSTTPTPCFADIVGRDLEIIGLGKLGHVGMLEGNLVDEVLNEDTVLQTNTIDDFRSRTTFWGEKYGLPHHENLTQDQSMNIIATAAKQYECKVNYTFTWKYKPCNPGSPAVFRCDSFVYYSYLKGAHLKIGEYIPIITYPTNLFSRFLRCRWDGVVSCFESNDLVQSHLIPFTPDKLLTNNINNELAKDNVNLISLDQLTNQYLTSTIVPRKDKITWLWNLLERYKSDPNRYEYIESTLAGLAPHEIITPIIQSYRQENDLFIKSKLLDLLIISLSSNDFKINDLSFITAKSFFQQILSNENNPKIAAQIIAYYPRVFLDSTTYQMIIDHIEVLKQQDIEECSDSIAYNSSFWGNLLQFMIDQKGEQSEWFEKISGLAEQYSNDPDFKTHLPLRLKQQYKHNDFLVKDLFYITLRDMMKDVKPGKLNNKTSQQINSYLKNTIKNRALPVSITQELIYKVKELTKKREEAWKLHSIY